MKYKTRSIRLNEDLLKMADKKKININRLTVETLQKLLLGQCACPVCGQKIKKLD